MKKFAAIAIAAMLCIVMIPVARAAGDPVQINTPDELAAIADNPGGSYVLAADIDMQGVDWTPIAFSGQFDGAGHTIFNLTITKLGTDHATTVDGNVKKYDTLFAGLFSVVKNASIKDLNLLNTVVNITTDKDCFVAGLAGYIDNTTITGCSVQGRLSLGKTFKMVGVGGIAGFGGGTITKCSADIEVVYVGGDVKSKCEEFIGAMLACGDADLDSCTVKLRAWASVKGYCHNGGLVGMWYLNSSAVKRRSGYVKNCTSDAEINFFENNPDRRAYCKPYIGEILSGALSATNNKTLNFKNGETKNYSKTLSPESDPNPNYTKTVTKPTCTEFGYTTYTNANSGYTYTDDYTAPAHTPGEWVTVTKATTDAPGLERQTCTVCGKVLGEREIAKLPPRVPVPGDWKVEKQPTYQQEGIRRQYDKETNALLKEETIPKLVYVSSCKLDRAELNIAYKSSARLTADIQPSGATDRTVKWSSSDTHVATVDSQGNVVAVGKGSAVITCATSDGNATATSKVTVTYTFWQWVIKIVLFGWIWY